MVKWLKNDRSEAVGETVPDPVAEDIRERLLEWGEPTDAVRARILQRVLTSSTRSIPDPRVVRRHRLFHLIRFPALAFLLLLGFLGGYVGVVVAEGDSLPGEPLYPLERRAEALLLSLTPQTRRCAMELRLLENRIYEIRAMLDMGRTLPDGLIQETTLLVSGLPKTLESVPVQCESVAVALESHYATLQALNERHPGLWELVELMEAFESTIDQLRDTG